MYLEEELELSVEHSYESHNPKRMWFYNLFYQWGKNLLAPKLESRCFRQARFCFSLHSVMTLNTAYSCIKLMQLQTGRIPYTFSLTLQYAFT